MKKIIIIGSGGHLISTINLILSTGEFKIVGLVDLIKSKKKVLGYSVIGTEKDLPQLIKSGIKYCSIGIGQIKDPNPRIRVFNLLKKLGFIIPSIISKYSNCSNASKIGEGTNIFSNTFINSNVTIGKNCIINTGSIIEHDVNIGDHCHIATGAIMNGEITVGKESFIGSRVVTKQCISIGKNCVIGAGVVLNNDVESNQVIKS